MSDKPVLYLMRLSPPARAVLMCAAELGVELEEKDVDMAAHEHLSESFIQKNPQQTIPVLDDNGVFVSDSHAICAYLSEKYAETDNFYPKDLEKRALCDTRLHFDSALFARSYFLLAPVLFHNSNEWSEYGVQLIQRGYDILACILENGPYVCGDDITIADFCLIATVTSMHENVELDAEKHGKIIEWIDRMAQLPSYDEFIGIRSKEFQDWVRAKREQNAAEAAEATDADGAAAEDDHANQE